MHYVSIVKFVVTYFAYHVFYSNVLNRVQLDGHVGSFVNRAYSDSRNHSLFNLIGNIKHANDRRHNTDYLLFLK